VQHLAIDSAHALRAFGATPHPAAASLTAFAKPSHPSPARGEGKHWHCPLLRNIAKRFALSFGTLAR